MTVTDNRDTDVLTERWLDDTMTNAERVSWLDAELAKAGMEMAKEGRSREYTLPQVLGLPQPYDKIPGLFFKRPKLGHKLDLQRRFSTLDREGEGRDQEIAEGLIDLVVPYSFLEVDGELRPARRAQLMFEVFEDHEELSEFILTLLTSKREDAQGPNA